LLVALTFGRHRPVTTCRTAAGVAARGGHVVDARPAPRAAAEVQTTGVGQMSRAAARATAAILAGNRCGNPLLARELAYSLVRAAAGRVIERSAPSSPTSVTLMWAFRGRCRLISARLASLSEMRTPRSFDGRRCLGQEFSVIDLKNGTG